MIEILLYAQKILEDNQIKYWIDCGSLLHLYRDGYLPKDDIDFCLLYNEYDKVKEILLKHSSEFDFIHFRSKEITIKYKGIKCDFIFGEIKEENFYQEPE
jgi:phosphorylcholine metabolism protein LicD